MEPKSEFNLRDHLNAWKSEICSSKSMDESNYTELESHLLENMDQLKFAGLTEEEAYLLARRRLGETGFLAHEFGKVNKLKILTGRIIDFVTGIMLYLIITSIGGIIANGIFYSSPFLGVDPEQLKVINAFLLAITVTLIVSLAYYLLKKPNGIFLGSKLLPFSILLMVGLKLIQYSMRSLSARVFGDNSYSFELLGSLQLQASFFNLGIMLIVFITAIAAYINNRNSTKVTEIA